jgi:hypothetical protein
MIYSLQSNIGEKLTAGQLRYVVYPLTNVCFELETKSITGHC